MQILVNFKGVRYQMLKRLREKLKKRVKEFLRKKEVPSAIKNDYDK